MFSTTRVVAMSSMAFFALSIAPAGFGATLRVPADYASIAAAVAAASSNDTIVVRSNYAGEAGAFTFDLKNLTFVSVDTDYATPFAGAKIDQAVNIDTGGVGTYNSNVSFWGFSISNTGGAGVTIGGNGTITFTNCSLNSNIWGAIIAEGNGTTVNLDSTTVNDNQHGGILTQYGFPNPKVINVTNSSTVNHNFTAGGGNAPSIELNAPTSLTIDNSEVNNTVGCGVLVGSADTTVTLYGGHANGNNVGIQANFQCAINVLNGSTVSNNAWPGINRAYNGGALSTITVDASTIQGNTNSPGIITNNSSGPVNITLTNGSVVAENGPANIETDEDGAVTVTNSSVTSATGTGDGIVLTAGKNVSLSVTNSSISGNPRFGVFNYNCVVDPTIITNSTFTGNQRGIHNGGNLNGMAVSGTSFSGNTEHGIFLAGVAPNATFTNCSFANEYVGFALAWNTASFDTSFTGCTFDMLDYDLFVSGDNSFAQTVNVSQCTFSRDFTTVDPGRTPISSALTANALNISRCIFRDGSGNTTPAVKAHAGLGDSTIVNCLFDQGDDVTSLTATAGKTVNVYNCTFSNTSMAAKAVKLGDTGSYDVRNNIFDGFGTGIWTLTSSLTQTNNLFGVGMTPLAGAVTIPGPNSLVDVDPQFVTASSGVGTGNFHLKATSPVINQGVDGLTNVDLDGNPRPYGAHPDFGAYEWSPSTTVDDWQMY
ncbi:MAG: right-handed parallel beta-helix repeat-containing protein [bacterium]